jgi:hypothetical protein
MRTFTVYVLAAMLALLAICGCSTTGSVAFRGGFARAHPHLLRFITGNDDYIRQAATGDTDTSTTSLSAHSDGSYAPACAENGSCNGDISTATGLPKTLHVYGYFRGDGTYVRGYYRSR